MGDMMAITIEDLIEVFSSATRGENPRAGIRAVVNAIRIDLWSIAGNVAVSERLYEILGDESGNEKAEYTGGMNDLNVSPAADPVCVWTRTPHTALYSSQCDEYYLHEDYLHEVNNSGMCHRCGKPITFREEQSR